MKSTPLFIGYFDTEEKILSATRAATAAGLGVQDVYTPYAVHGLDEAMGLPPSRLTWVCFLAGLIGATAALSFQYYTSVVSWPLNIGGKPFNSLPAFIPVAFELTILFAGLGSVAAFFLRSRLGPGKVAQVLEGVTNDRFAIALVGSEESVQRVFQANGVLHTEKREIPS